MPPESIGDTLNEGSLASPTSDAVRLVPQLFLALECGRPLAAGARWSLADIDAVVVGRGSRREHARSVEAGVRTLFVRVPDRWMSSRHARLVRAADVWTVEDAQSTNGTWVNGERVATSVVTADDVVELGHSLFFVREAEVPVASIDDDTDAEGYPPDAVAGMATLLPAYAARLGALARIAPTSIPVLLLGETGTGKEVVARALHTLSGRQGEFVAVNCGALPETLLESQLFGHVKGAFSGAVRDAPGFVRSADHGTLFLDEIGDLSLRSQAALLRVLQEREVVPVGATRPISVDIRVVAATHRPLDAMAARGEFRSDLFARLAGLRLALPPLRDRREDIGLLVAALLRGAAPDRAHALSFSVAAGRALLGYDWPLNVRELAQALALAVALAPPAPLGSAEAGSAVVDLGHLPPPVAAARPGAQPAGAGAAPASLSDEDMRLRAELLAHLELAAGNVSEVARAMGKQRTQIHRWIKRFAIDLHAFRR